MSKHYPLNIWQTGLKEPYKSLQFLSGWNKCCYRCFTAWESNILKYCITSQQRKSLFELGIYAMSIDFQLIFKLLLSSLNTVSFRTTDGYRFLPQTVQNSVAYYLMDKMDKKYLGYIRFVLCDHMMWKQMPNTTKIEWFFNQTTFTLWYSKYLSNMQGYINQAFNS